jgi:hypothetical protein
VLDKEGPLKLEMLVITGSQASTQLHHCSRPS